MHTEVEVPKCKCGSIMELVVYIKPVGGEPGLRAYECPVCRALATVDEAPAQPPENSR